MKDHESVPEAPKSRNMEQDDLSSYSPYTLPIYLGIVPILISRLLPGSPDFLFPTFPGFGIGSWSSNLASTLSIQLPPENSVESQAALPCSVCSLWCMVRQRLTSMEARTPGPQTGHKTRLKRNQVLRQGELFWLFTGRFKVSSGTVKLRRSS